MQLIKNAMIYRLNREVPFDAEAMEEQLKAFEFAEAGSQDMAKVGWVPPLGENSNLLTHEVSGHILLVAQRQEKILPSDVIKKELKARVDKLEQEQDRKLKKTEKDSLKDEVLHNLLPKAFSRYSQVRLWIDTNTGLILVDAGSAKKAEDTLALLRKSLGSLPVIPLTMESPIELSLTEWVRGGDLPAGFTLGDEAELKAVLEDGGTVRVKKQDLVSDEVKEHIEAGKLVTKLAMSWDERVSFTIASDGSLKKIKFSDVLLEQNDDIDREDVAARFDADAALQFGELAALISQLTVALGGEKARG